ncbi:MAG: 3-oxoacyl-ACP synthase, partial [Myxococcota bacterium]
MSVPDQVVTNHDLAKLMNTNDEWIRQRTGIAERRWIEDGESPASLAEGAAREALGDAGLSESDVDCILLSTLS